jgi:hypothetical protein
MVADYIAKGTKMDNQQLIEAIAAIQRCSDPTCATVSGAFLEVLRDLARKQDIVAIAEANKVYAESCPGSAEFIAARLPGILCNRFFTLYPNFDYDTFIVWSVKNPGWGNEIIESYNNAKMLQNCINKIVNSVRSIS